VSSVAKPSVNGQRGLAKVFRAVSSGSIQVKRFLVKIREDYLLMAYIPDSIEVGEFTPLKKLTDATLRQYAPHINVVVSPLVTTFGVSNDYMGVRLKCDTCNTGESSTYRFGREGEFTDIVNTFTEKHLHRDTNSNS
jgi:hypothetical protein